MSNNLSMIPNPAPIEMDDDGEANYRFMAGAPDLTTGSNSFFSTITVGTMSYLWNIREPRNEPIEAWHLGDRTTGTDFMTAGPDNVEIILRDPPGSLSKSFIETGTTITTKSGFSTGFGQNIEQEMTTSLGPKITTFVGLGAGVITTTETKLDISAGVKTETKLTSGTENTQVTTFTERFETSDDPLFVGHYGDLFIGNSTNIIYGLTNSITIVKNHENEFEDEEEGEAFVTEGAYSIAPSVSLAFGQEFATRFVFTQFALEEMIIPSWIEALAMTLEPAGTPVSTDVISEPVYVSKLPHSHENFGKLNTDKEAFGSSAVSANQFHDGPSYKIYFPDNYDLANFKTDMVMYYNNQINGWLEILTQNEREKVHMQHLGNYSFSAGASVQYSKTNSATTSRTSTFNMMINPTIGLVQGVEVMGIGFDVTTKYEIVAEAAITAEASWETSITSGFILSETGDDDHISVDFGMTESGTIAFRTRGGRTSCPYEAQLISQYYEPGRHVLMEATMQVEVPKISIVSAPHVINVPENRAATFQIALTNESESGDGNWFQLKVDETTNPHGAVFKVDGGVIGNGRQFMLFPGEVLYKTITVEKGTVDNYENMGLIIASNCQYDLTDDIWPSIYDKVYVSVDFVPGVSHVAIAEPRQNWILNADSSTGDVLEITIRDFDVNYPNFGNIRLQYRPAASPVWNTITTFYPSAMYNAAQGVKEDIGTRSVIVFPWKMPDPDGQYEIRAITSSVDNMGLILSTYTTDAVSGYKDMQRPVALGAPSPTNGILGAGDELSITFNEDIQTGLLTRDNFRISGVLNEQEIAEPNVGLRFTGTQSANTELLIFANGSFSIETWYMRDPNTAGTLFEYGGISLGFNAAGNAVLKIGAETYTSTIATANDQTWKFIAMAYNRDNNTVSVHQFEGSTDNALFTNRQLTAIPETQGILTVGDGFRGAVAQLHFYGISRAYADISADKSKTKSGREFGLIGHWTLDEGKGSIAQDKARSRHLLLGNTDWYIYPAGRAKQTGNNSYFAIPTSTYSLNMFSDFTLEFWFRSEGAAQAEQTLFSADNGYIAVNATGGLTLYNRNGNEIRTLTASNIMDTQWRHVAMSVRRFGSINVYIDGESVAVFDERLLGDFSSGFYYFGARRAPDNTFTNYFNGYFDEIRIWNSALTRDGIQLNKNNKLRGNEPGLQAYYPFEVYNRQQSGLITIIASNENMVEGESSVATGTGTAEQFSTTAVAVKDMRPIEDVPFTFVASNNKIVFTLLPDYFSRVEGTVLNISVSDVRDMRNNKSNTESWTAYVRRNALQWNTDPISIVMQEGELRSFTARITNTGGIPVSYFIENLPTWLTASNLSGSLQPLTSRDITFTVVQGQNVGNYETAIGLTSGNRITEILPVQLKIRRQRPDWNVNPHDFESSMNITGRIRIEGVNQTDTEDLLAAFIGGLCVGVTSPIYIDRQDAYFTFADIYGNAQHNNQPITFKLWAASTGRVYPLVETTPVSDIRFSPSLILGSISTPVIFNALDVAEQSIALRNGWNWISANLLNNNPSILDQMKSSLANTGMLIKGGDAFIQQPNWVGTLSSISATTMYSVRVNRDHTLILTGQYAPANTQITIAQGWNRIGYIPQFNLPVEDAIAGINALEGDQIKGQTGFAIYTGRDWVGTLTFMQPGRGYMYYSTGAASQNLVYPSQPVAPSMQRSSIETKSASRWTANPAQYSNSMTMTAIVVNGNVELRSSQIEIAAFSGTECRGSAMLQYVESMNKYVGFLMIYGEGNESITLRVYDHATLTEQVVNNAPVVFAADAIFGDPSNPYVVSLNVLEELTTDADMITASDFRIYPNPARAILYVAHPLESIDLLEIVDASGRIVFRQKNFADASIDISDLVPGVYLLRAIKDEQLVVIRFVKE